MLPWSQPSLQLNLITIICYITLIKLEYVFCSNFMSPEVPWVLHQTLPGSMFYVMPSSIPAPLATCPPYSYPSFFPNLILLDSVSLLTLPDLP